MNIYWPHVMNIVVIFYILFWILMGVLFIRLRRNHHTEMAVLNQRKKESQEELRKSKEWLASTKKGLEEVQKMRLKWAIMKIEAERGTDT